MLAVERAKEWFGLGNRFGVAQQQVSGRLQGVVKGRDQLALQAGLEINQQVATAHQPDLRERRVGRDVVHRENAALADGLANPVGAVAADEVAPQALGRYVRDDAVRINAGARVLDRLRAGVGCKNLERRGRGARRQGLDELRPGDRERVGLLAGRAGGHPDAHGRFVRGVREQGREDHGLQGFELPGRAEEAGDLNEQIFVELPELGGVCVQVSLVFGQSRAMVQHHAPLDAPLDAAGLVGGEIDAGCGPQQAKHRRHAGVWLAVRRLARRARLGLAQQRMPAEPHQVPGDLGRRQHEVDAPAGGGAVRHPRKLRGGLVLREGAAARRFDRVETLGAVRPAAGEHHADGQAAALGGQRGHELVDGGLLAQARRARG